MIDENYRYWQQNGSGWRAEYARRKTFIPFYHIQELLIATVAERAAPARVLEFGCGVGRHLSYLHRIPGVTVHGYDQSPTMVAEMAAWAPTGFIEKHVTIGGPVPHLPFADGAFDIVFTCEVLVHVRPEHVSAILKELRRVSRGLVFHLEPTPSTPLIHSEHGGCWGHDLVSLYRELGAQPEIMPYLFASQAPIVVEADDPGRFTAKSLWLGEVASQLFRAMEQALCATIEPAVADGALTVDRNLGLEGLQSAGLLEKLRRPLLIEALEAARRDTKAAQEQRTDLERQLVALEREAAHLRAYRHYVEGYIAEASAGAHDACRLNVFSSSNRHPIRIEVIDPNPLSKGRQVWLRMAHRDKGAPAVPWSLLTLPDSWSAVDAPGCTFDQALLGTEGELLLPAGDTPQLSFMRHPWSGRVRITWRDRDAIVDLYSERTLEITVDLATFLSAAREELVV